MGIISFIQNPVQIKSLMWAVFGKNRRFIVCLQPETDKKRVFMSASK